MRIQRIYAANVREAMRQVREQLGPEAVILSNKRVAEGIEIVAAIDYDEKALDAAPEAAQSTPSLNAANTHPPLALDRVSAPVGAEGINKGIKNAVSAPSAAQPTSALDRVSAPAGAEGRNKQRNKQSQLVPRSAAARDARRD